MNCRSTTASFTPWDKLSNGVNAHAGRTPCVVPTHFIKLEFRAAVFAQKISAIQNNSAPQPCAAHAVVISIELKKEGKI
jgi:hypothetical protein